MPKVVIFVCAPYLMPHPVEPNFLFFFSINAAALDNPDDLVADLREFLGGHSEIFVNDA